MYCFDVCFSFYSVFHSIFQKNCCYFLNGNGLCICVWRWEWGVGVGVGIECNVTMTLRITNIIREQSLSKCLVYNLCI